MGLYATKQVIKQSINNADLYAYLVGFDIGNDGKMHYRIDDLVKILVNSIPDFAFGCHSGNSTQNEEIVKFLCEAAKAIYSIDAFKEAKEIYVNQCNEINDDIEDKYLKRGEFGELILHLLLKHYHDTIPLISKIYFRDSFGTAVHGFDAVHIQPSTKTLWLGESKLYTDGKQGIKALINDIKAHFVADYLNSEFAIVSRKIKLFDNIPERDEWVNFLQESTSLKDKIRQINIPLLCTYTSENFTNFQDETLPEFIAEYTKEIQSMKQYFDANNDHVLKNQLNIILLLFPVKSKKELVKRLHKNLSIMQQLGEF